MLLRTAAPGIVRATAPAFTPADLTGLTAWLDAESNTITDPFSPWPDESASNNDWATAVGGEEPALIDVSGTQFVDYAGSGDGTTGSGEEHKGPLQPVTTLFTSENQWFFAIVYNLDAINASVGDADNFEGDMLFTNWRRELVLNADPNELVLAHWDGTDVTLISSGTAQGTGTTRIVCCWQNGTGAGGLAMKVGSAAAQTATASDVGALVNASDAMWIGSPDTGQTTAFHWLNGKVGALITCSSKPPDSEIDDLVTWAQNTYGAA